MTNPRTDRLHAGGVALCLFALYAASAPRTVALEDDGLFVLSSYFLAGAHPPGYPLHAMLGKLFTLLPFGSVAYRVHLLSAAFGALACGALWMCARALGGSRPAAWLAALGLGLTPVFWSQAIIAEVYTLNAFFFFALMLLALRGAPLAAIALVAGLSLSNHWPLMLLMAPALAVVLWPRRREWLRRAPLLAALAALGLAPYALLVVRSWSSPVSFVGPIESLRELWYVVSREAYAGIDVSPTATWLDRARFLGFAGGELVYQFAAAGTALAAIGFAQQWRAWGRRVSVALTSGFLLPTAGLLLLLRFDYDALHKHIFHVYPIPAYGIAALWMGLGASWAASRMRFAAVPAAAGGIAVLGLIFAVATQTNLRSGYDWTRRYAAAVLETLPRNAHLFVHGDSEIGPIAYFHMIEGWRPDVTLHQWQGLLFGNRLAPPLHTGVDAMRAKVRAFAQEQAQPVAFTHDFPEALGRRDRLLYTEVDRDAPRGGAIDVPEAQWRFFEESVLGDTESDPWTRFNQRELRLRGARLLAASRPREGPPDARAARLLGALQSDFWGAIGIAEGMMANPHGHAVGEVARHLDIARSRMPQDLAGKRVALYFELRGYLRLEVGDRAGGAGDLETAVSLWPAPQNRAASVLADLYAKSGEQEALRVLRARLKR